MASQAMSRHQFSGGRENIRMRQVMIPRTGVTGENGTRNGRSASGWITRMMRTAAQTTVNAKRVPMFVRSARMRKGRKAAPMATATPVRMVAFQGVRYLSCTAPKKDGEERPARALARHRQPDARLAEHHDEQDGCDAGHRPEADEEPHPGEARLAEGVRDRDLD